VTAIVIIAAPFAGYQLHKLIVDEDENKQRELAEITRRGEQVARESQLRRDAPERSARAIELVKKTLVDAIAPGAADTTGGLAVPISNFLHPPEKWVADIINGYYDAMGPYLPYDRVSATYEANVNAVSRDELSAKLYEAGERLRPFNYQGADVFDRYLTGTPFLDFFRDTVLPMRIKDQSGLSINGWWRHQARGRPRYFRRKLLKTYQECIWESVRSLLLTHKINSSRKSLTLKSLLPVSPSKGNSPL